MTSKPPITSPRHMLPFERLSPLDFERLCMWLIRREGYQRAEHLGASGFEQGRDIVAWRKDKRFVFQCKRVRSFGPKSAEREVKKLRSLSSDNRPDVIVFIVTTSVSMRTRTVARAVWGDDASVVFWAGSELDERVKRFPDLLREFFGLEVDEYRIRRTLGRISFGALAAERDDTLQEYFIESESYRLLRSGKKSVVLGNRGSGKTAIFKMIAQHAREAGASVIELAPEDYSYEVITQIVAPEDGGSWIKQGAYAASWKYLFYVLAMKAVTKRGKKLKTGAAGRIYRYLRDTHSNIDKNPVAVLISYLSRLEGIKVGDYEVAAKANKLQGLYKLEEIAALLAPLNELCEIYPVVILVDELDRGWDGSEDAIAFVAGLFQAAISIQKETPALRVAISLRSELYESIPALYEDAQKVRDFIELVEWDEPQLFNLITRRIAHSLSDSVDAGDPQALWNAVFEQTLGYRGTNSFNYVVDRTLYRPRELIQFCSDIRDYAIRMSVDFPIGYKAIASAEIKYSTDRVSDIAAEYRFRYPGLKSVFETFRGLTYTLEREELVEHLQNLANGSRPVSEEAADWCLGTQPGQLIETLWNVGFLRGQAVGGLRGKQRSGSEYLGPHQISHLNLHDLPRFSVHPMFRAYLGLKERRKAKNPSPR